MDGISLLQDFAVILVVAGISGWIFRRLGLSAVVGYLVAGIIIGPYTPPFTLVSDVDRIETLTDLGLAFLMFFVGLGLSLKRIRRMGAGVVATTAITAFCVFQASQLFGNIMGWDETVSFIFAAMLMTSSSAIITKMLAETGLTHERFAQNAQGVTVLEDVVAIVLLTLLGSKLQLADTPTRTVEDTLFLLVAFAALLLVCGLIFVPKLLSRFGGSGDSDLHSVLVSGLVFIAGVASIRAGFSVALGAFLFGVVISETRFKTQIQKSLSGAQDMFSAIFFVAIGMLIDIRAFGENAGLILGIAAFAIVARSLAATIGFTLSGNPLPLAVGSAIVVTPIGEFAYVIAQLGVDAGAVPSSFYAVAVGVSIVTAICAPIFAKKASVVESWVQRRQPAWLESALANYHARLSAGLAGMSDNHVWRLTKRRVGWTLIQFLLLGGLFGFANPLLAGLQAVGERAGVPGGNLTVLFWVVLLAICLLLLVAIWQNLQTLSMIYGEAFVERLGGGDRRRLVAQYTLQIVSFILLTAGVLLGFPLEDMTPFFASVLVAGPVIFSLVLWKQLAGLHSRLESSLLNEDPAGRQRSLADVVSASEHHNNWNLELTEIQIPDLATCAGKTIQELELRNRFGLSILEINRQGIVIDRVKPSDRLFPGDILLAVGTEDQISKGTEFLANEGVAGEESADFSESVLDEVLLTSTCRILGQSIAKSGIAAATGVQVVGIERQTKHVLNPPGDEIFQDGDRLLLLGSAAEIRTFRKWLSV
ncbi:MAG: cation:proton antiporter [Terrimicrobiaceae bacterium]